MHGSAIATGLVVRTQLTVNCELQVPSSAPPSPSLRASRMLLGLAEAPLAPQPLGEREAAQWHSGTC